MNDGGFIEELAERKISLTNFFDLLWMWDDLEYEAKEAVMRKFIEEERMNKNNDSSNTAWK